jgi:predicted nucleotide-binding protein
MPEKPEPAQQEAAAMSVEEKIFTDMNRAIEISVASLQYQNIRDADTAAYMAEVIYSTAKGQALKPEVLMILKIIKNAPCLFAPLTRAMVFQNEGYFEKAREQLQKGLAITDEAIATIDEYAQCPHPDDDILNVWRPMLSAFPIIFKGSDAYIEAEIVGYQGNIPLYKKLLLEAVEEYRQISTIPATRDPGVMALISLCKSIADNLETRIAASNSWLTQRYILPTGDKVFIIHGHDEAKWRELRDLLEKKLKLKTVVLKEEPGAGETLIRKFEEYADDCCYAFALLTPDDLIRKTSEEEYSQARPNVLFEMGWFYGRFGPSRLCILKKSTTEIPSDLDGIVTIDFQNDVAEGYVKIQAELKRAKVLKKGRRK